MGTQPKLTIEQARALRQADFRHGDLKRKAAELGVCTETVRRCRRRITYKLVRA